MSTLRNLGFVMLAALCPVASAAAQGYGPVYIQQPGQPPQPMYFDRVIVQPNTGRAYPYMGNAQPMIIPVQRAPRRAAHRKPRPASSALMPDLKKSSRIKKISVENELDSPAAPTKRAARREKVSPASDKDVRIIRAEAEVRIIGKDQMSIRLFRRGSSPEARAD